MIPPSINPDPVDGIAISEALESEMRGLISAIECVCPEKTATYVSGPITTGKRFLEWYLEIGHRIEQDALRYGQELSSTVRRQNEREIIAVASIVRAQGAIVIEPTSLDVLQWRQSDYLAFWIEVLTRFCRRIILVDGWQYSVGSVVEFFHSIRNGIVAQDSNFKSVTESDGRAQIQEALAFVESRQFTSPRLRSWALAIRTVISN